MYFTLNMLIYVSNVTSLFAKLCTHLEFTRTSCCTKGFVILYTYMYSSVDDYEAVYKVEWANYIVN